MGELLCQRVGVVADGEYVLLDGRRLGLEGHQLVRGGIEGDLDNALFPLAHQGQPLAKFLQHLVQGFPVCLERRGEQHVKHVIVSFSSASRGVLCALPGNVCFGVPRSTRVLKEDVRSVFFTSDPEPHLPHVCTHTRSADSQL